MKDERGRPKLSEREQQLISLAAQGFTDAGIAHRLGISEATVNTYWGRVRIKLGPMNRTELVAMALREEGERNIAGLKAENERLLSQLEQMQGERLLTTDDALTRQLFEEAPDAIVVVSESGEITLCNRQADEMFGYHRDELIGRSVSSLIPPRLRVQHRKHMDDYMENPERRPMGEHMATLALRKDGSEFTVAATLNSVELAGEKAVICLLRDMSKEDAALNQFAERHEDAEARPS
jgi:PAS domain S-box-containing protein